MNRQPYPSTSRQESENSGLRNLLEADFDVAPLIQRINQFDIPRGDQLVFDEHCGGYWFLLQNAHRERNQFIAVPFRKIGHRADQSRTWFRSSIRASRIAFWPMTAQRWLSPASSKARSAASAQMSFTVPISVRRGGTGEDTGAELRAPVPSCLDR